MEKINYLKHLSFSYCITLIVGVMFSNALGWEGLIKDVGVSGAWIISTIFHSIYTFIIITGILINIFVIVKTKKCINIKAIYFPAIFAIVFFHMTLYFFHDLNFMVNVLMLFISGFTFSFIFSVNTYLNSPTSLTNK
jgi:hypothetical protein